jgi:hypothetical protein
MSIRTARKYLYCYALQLLFFSSLEKHPKDAHHKKKSCFYLELDSKYKPEKILQKKKKVIMEFIIDETLLKVSNEYIWLWVAIETIDKTILGIQISVERSMLLAERFIHQLSTNYGKRTVSTDGGT